VQVTAEAAIGAGSPVLGYNASKTLSERAAWDFITTADPKPSFDLSTINPDIITGPPLQPISAPEKINETNVFAVYNFMNGTYKKVEDVRFPFYDFVSRTISRLSKTKCSLSKLHSAFTIEY
jgi:hypothetical protein